MDGGRVEPSKRVRQTQLLSAGLHVPGGDPSLAVRAGPPAGPGRRFIRLIPAYGDMDRSLPTLVLALALGVLLGIAAGYWVAGTGSSDGPGVADDLAGNTIWVGGTLERVDGSTVHVNTGRFGGGPVPLGVADAALFACSPAGDGVTCTAAARPGELPTDRSVCASARVEGDDLVGIKVFANATCSLGTP